MTNSLLFKDIERPSDDFDIMITYVFDGEKYTVSLYTTKKDVNVAVIAKKYGGGGHPQAAGFVCSGIDLPIDLSGS